MKSRSFLSGFFCWVEMADAFSSRQVSKVFNMFVENSVEKGHSIFVSDSSGNGSTLCTGAGAGLSMM